MNHRVASIGHAEDLKEAATALSDVFQKDETLKGFVDTEEGRFSFFHANLKAMANFCHVLVCKSSDDDDDKEPSKPKCVMACIPAFSKSREEFVMKHKSKNGLDKRL